MAVADREGGFSEKAFYLEEFRGRTLAVAAPVEDLRAPAALEAVLEELEQNRTRVVLLSTGAEALRLLKAPLLSAAAPRLSAAVWGALRGSPRAGIPVAAAGFQRSACAIATRLGVSKLVWIDPDGGLLRPDGARLSFVDLAELRALPRAGLSPGRKLLMDEIEAALAAGLPAVNLCTLAGLGDDLFTYAGSGTFFTRERYVRVRRLSIDDFDAADHLIGRGVAEGYLTPRSPEQVESVLVNGFGAFVEGTHLAGIGALLHRESAGVGEIASLYTLTRFLGEGIGGHLVGFALERAAELGLDYVFACTTSERVAGFFERCGFRAVPADEVPAEKWDDYDPERRAKVCCLRREVR